MVIYGRSIDYEYAVEIYKAIKCNTYSEEKFQKSINEILKIAQEYKLSGNCFQSYTAWLIINDENPFSLDCEMKKKENSLKKFAEEDISFLRKMFFVSVDENDDLPQNAKQLFKMLEDFKIENDERETNLTVIGKLACDLAHKLSDTSSDEEFLNTISEFYSLCGVGMFGLNKAFRIKEHTDGNFSLIPVSVFDEVLFCDLWGYEDQKKQLIENTEFFLNGDPANNVLLYGDSGTGKSTCIKALLNEYHHRGLRIIEVYKHQFKFLSPLINMLKNRHYFFIIYMDDLSFEDFEIEYKYLKAVIEGGMETNPDNVLIYATSNRRHLIKETWKDRSDYDEDMHHSDTMQEKLSLSDRFGVAINFSKPVQKEYFEIVLHLAKKYKIDIPKNELIDTARAWGVQHGGYSGRAAKQLIKKLTVKKHNGQL